MIVGALISGASSALKDTTSQIIKDSYEGLKSLVIKNWKSKTETDVQANEIEAKIFLDNLESDPESFGKPLEKKLHEIMPQPDATLIEQAEKLEKLLNKADIISKNFRVKMQDNNQGLQIGDHNVQINSFK